MSASDLKAHMEIGAPVTYEEMMKMRNDETTIPAAETSMEKHPYIFEDKAIGTMRYCIVSMLSNILQQKHDDGKNYIKIRATFQTQKEAVDSVLALDSEKCDMYLYELYKFCAVPCGEAFRSLGDEDRDCALNDAMKAYKKYRIEHNVAYEMRKKTMMDDINRQEKDKERIRNGEMDASSLDSSSILPEPVASLQNNLNSVDNSMKSDTPFNHFNYAVMALVDLRGVRDIPSVLTDCNIIKICGVFKEEKYANEHVQLLRQNVKYKHIDIYVCCLYEWLQIPPDQEKLEKVEYTHDKLNEVLSEKNPQSTPTQIYESLQEDGDTMHE